MKFTQKEVSLFKALLENSRATCKELSKKSLLTPETVSQKVRYFKDEGIIKAYRTQINLEMLGLHEYICFIKTQARNHKTLEKLQTFLINSKYTSWIGKGIGNYDFKVSLFVRTNFDVKEFEKELYHYFNSVIAKIELNQVLSKKKNPHSNLIEYIFSDDILSSNIVDTNKISHQTPIDKSKNIKLSNIELQILYHISNNSRISLHELSKLTKTSIENIHYYFKKLQKLEVIRKFSINLNGQYFNTSLSILLLKTNPNITSSFINYTLKNKNTTSVIEMLGTYTIQIACVYKTLYELYDFVNKLNEEFEKDIITIEYFFTYNFYKYPQIPKIIFE